MLLDTHAGRFDRLYTIQEDNDWDDDSHKHYRDSLLTEKYLYQACMTHDRTIL